MARQRLAQQGVHPGDVGGNVFCALECCHSKALQIYKMNSSSLIFYFNTERLKTELFALNLKIDTFSKEKEIENRFLLLFRRKRYFKGVIS